MRKDATVREPIKIEPLTLGDIERYAKRLKIAGFRGVFMRQMLPQRPHESECGILNLGSLESNGTHWTCYVKAKDESFYFDSFGNAPPPVELVTYLTSPNLVYNLNRIQGFNDPPICGHLCLEVLRRSCGTGDGWVSTVNNLSHDKYVWRTWFPLE